MQTNPSVSPKMLAPRNRTLRCNQAELKQLGNQLLTQYAEWFDALL